MILSEEELETYIHDDLSHNWGMGLFDRGFRTTYSELFRSNFDLKPVWLRQVELGNYGRCDILGYYRVGSCIYVELMELKSGAIKSDDFDQILRYREGIKQYVGNRLKIHFTCYLVGNGISSGHYIQNYVPNLYLVDFAYGLNGIDFDQHEGRWYRTESSNFDFFKSIKNAKKIHGY